MNLRVVPFLCAPLLGALIGALSLAATGCVVTPDNSPPPAVVVTGGTYTVDWTINSDKDPSACNQSLSSTIEIQVTDSNGNSAGTFSQQCTAFATSITLAPGTYSATALLLDSAGNPRTTPASLPPFSLDSNQEVIAPVDFPADSFL